jgi:transposase-like protein
VDTSVQRTQGFESSATVIRRRKRRSPEETLQIVRETLQSHESVAMIARRPGVNAN